MTGQLFTFRDFQEHTVKSGCLDNVVQSLLLVALNAWPWPTNQK